MVEAIFSIRWVFGYSVTWPRGDKTQGQGGRWRRRRWWWRWWRWRWRRHGRDIITLCFLIYRFLIIFFVHAPHTPNSSNIVITSLQWKTKYQMTSIPDLTKNNYWPIWIHVVSLFKLRCLCYEIMKMTGWAKACQFIEKGSRYSYKEDMKRNEENRRSGSRINENSIEYDNNVHPW